MSALSLSSDALREDLEFIVAEGNTEENHPVEPLSVEIRGKEINFETYIQTIDSNSEKIAAFARSRLEGRLDIKVLEQAIDTNLQILFTSPELGEDLKSRGVAGYLKALQALDDLILSHLNVEGSQTLDTNPYTNGLVSLFRQRFYEMYCEKGAELNYDKKDLWKISLTNNVLIFSELQHVKGELTKELDSIDKRIQAAYRDPSIKVAPLLRTQKVYEQRVNTALPILAETQFLLTNISIDAFDSKNGRKSLLELEKVYAGLALYYSAIRIHDSKPEHPGFIGAAKGNEYTSVRRLISGIRGETLSYGYLLNLAEQLNKFLQDPELFETGDSGRDIQDLFCQIVSNLPAGFKLAKLDVRKAPPALDLFGIADFIFSAVDGAQGEEVPLLYIDTKNSRPEHLKDDRAIEVFSSGIDRNKVINTTEHSSSLVSTTKAAIRFIRDTNNSVASIRIPNTFTSMPLPARVVRDASALSVPGGCELPGVRVGRTSILTYGRDIIAILDTPSENPTILARGVRELLEGQKKVR